MALQILCFKKKQPKKHQTEKHNCLLPPKANQGETSATFQLNC